MPNATTERATLLQLAHELKLSIVAVFVPWSQSRSAKPGKPRVSDLSLNWRVTLQHNGRDVLTTDYTAGIAHAPSYKLLRGRGSYTQDEWDALWHEVEHGRRARVTTALGVIGTQDAILPDTADVLASLVLDASVLHYASFEDWAEEYGYDPDSRAAERIYSACLSTALRFQNAIGAEALARLMDASAEV